MFCLHVLRKHCEQSIVKVGIDIWKNKIHLQAYFCLTINTKQTSTMLPDDTQLYDRNVNGMEYIPNDTKNLAKRLIIYLWVIFVGDSVQNWKFGTLVL
jgi:hypothetical protein